MSANQMSKPDKVVIAVMLLYVTLGIGVVRSIMEASRLSQTASVGFIMFITFFSLGILWLLIYGIGEGKNWARISFMVLSIIGIPFAILPLLQSLSVTPISGLLGIAQTLLQIIALVLLFHGSSSDWFKQMKGNVTRTEQPFESITAATIKQENEVMKIEQRVASIRPELDRIEEERGEERIYAIIARELETSTMDKGLWTRLFAECNGDEKQMKILYIKQRAERLVSTERIAAKKVVAERAAAEKATTERIAAEKDVPLYKRSLEIKENLLGPDHPKVATCLNNLAELYMKQGQYLQAEPLYKRSYTINVKALGKDHPSVLTSLENMAIIYRKTGREKAAEGFEKRAASIRASGND